MKSVVSVFIGVIVAVLLLFLGTPPIPSQATITTYTDYTPVVDSEVLSHYPNFRIRERMWFGYAQGSTLVYLGVNPTGTGDGQYDTFQFWYETASNTWATDDVYTYTDRNGDGNLDTYSNTAASMATAGGKWYLYASDYLGAGI